MLGKDVFLVWLITELMTIGASLLAKYFYSFNPWKNLRYATIGLLLINVLISGTLYIL